MTFWRDTKAPKHKHEWLNWSEAKEIETRTSFHSTKKLYQIRLCRICNEAQTRDFQEVRS